VSNIFVTGYPGVGKTTLIRQLISELEAWNPSGFYTEEIRESGIRKGFEWVDLRGRSGILAHVERKGSCRVGRYGVDIEGFEAYLTSLDLDAAETGVVFLDEIGKMECLSSKFRFLVLAVLESKKPLIATIALRGTGFIESIKRRGDAKLFHLRHDNRDLVKTNILKHLTGPQNQNFRT